MISPSTIATTPQPVAESRATAHPADGDERPLLDPATILIDTKLRMPAIGGDALDRPRLIERLPGRGCRVGLVVAPAGYGKSTLLSQWAADLDRPVAWIRLDRDDSDPARFWSYVLEALRRALPGQISAAATALAYGSTTDPVPLVVNELSSVEDGVILVLDDYHEVRSDEVDEAIDRLLTYLPATATLVIAARHDPNLSFPRLRASDRLAEIRQEDLRFTEQEARQWLAAHHIKAIPEAVSVCVDIFEGWPAAFALALGSIASTPDRAAALSAVRGDARTVSAYIREEVTRHSEDRDALVVTALCPQVSSSLMDYVLETTGSQETLHQLQRSDVLLENVDHRGVWFRLHQLVADYLLVGYDSDPAVRKWMVRAAEWYAANDHAREALALFLRAKEYGAAGDVINRSWLDQVQRGQRDTLRRDLQRIEPHVAADNVSYLVTRAWLLAGEGRSRDAIAHLRRAAAVSDGRPLPDGAPSVEAARAVMDCLFILNGYPKTLLSATRADKLVPTDSEWRPLADLGIGHAHYMAGDLITAQLAFDRALASSSISLRAHAIGWSALVDVVLGDVEAANARLQEAATEWADDAPLADLPAVVMARGALECAQGRPIEAVGQLEACIQRLGATDPCDRLEALTWLADAEASVGRADRARHQLAEATRIAKRIGASDRQVQRIAEVEGRLGSAVTVTGRDPGLTDRETRILQLLSATHLSQREIGRELGVSFNTIKSHVKAVYVKLGACSREEASQIARLRGLL